MSMPTNRETVDESPPAILLPADVAPENWPIDHLITHDETPVDNQYVEKLARMLVHVLYSSWTPPGGQPFRAMTNVGLFFIPQNPAIVPDLMLVFGVETPADIEAPEHRSYLVWIVGKVPDLVLEVVSDRRGGEDSGKMSDYASQGIPYYVIYDPANRLGGGELRVFQLQGGVYQPIDPAWIPGLELGLTFWEGEFEGASHRWLRWCDRTGQVLPTAGERAESEQQRAESERRRAERLARRLKSLGVDPDSIQGGDDTNAV